MQPLVPLMLFGSLAASQIINCASFGIPDGYQGFSKWRASTKDCAEATNKLEDKFGQTVPEASSGCVSLASSGACEVSMCDASDVRREIPYEAAWLAARVVHGRHKTDGNVAGFVSLDDYGENSKYKVFVKVSRKDTPDPSNKRKRRGGLFGRRSSGPVGGDDDDVFQKQQQQPALPKEEEVGGATNATEPETGELMSALLKERAMGDGRWHSHDNVNFPNTNGLSANIRVAYGPREPLAPLQLDYAAEYLITAWDAQDGTPGSVRGRATSPRVGRPQQPQRPGHHP
ncbi:hypothetical protein PG994_014789 [Apiospora phragmitis]|uniref:Uncharacterized protein n=1 Tax=Apiospora phragmitis TaxID=2905665 RepID=A0ABR1SUM3_9PEZI